MIDFDFIFAQQFAEDLFFIHTKMMFFGHFKIFMDN